MRRISFLLCTAAMMLLHAGCNEQQINLNADSMTTGEYMKITAEEAKEIMEDVNAFILLDVRTEAEFKENRIDGAVLIPDNEIAERASEELPDKNARILVYCRTGRRSALAAKELINMGYNTVYDFGGIVDWPFETVSG